MTRTDQTRTLIDLDDPTASSSSFDRGFGDGVVKEKRDKEYKQNGINQSEQFADIGDYCYTNFDDHLKQNVDVIIGHVQSPAEFHVIQHSVYGDYLQLTDELETLDAVLTAAGVSLGQMSIGQPCAARYDVDQKLYRAEIRNIGAIKSSIFFVDYGNMAFVSNDQLFPLPKALIRLPCAAIQCSLADADKRQLTH